MFSHTVKLLMQLKYGSREVSSAVQSVTKFFCAGDCDLSDILATIDGQIEKAREEALSRKEILDKVDKWRHAKEEENWLDDYEKVNTTICINVVFSEDMSRED